MIKIRLGGVPEHFNLPIHLGIERGNFTKEGVSVEWINYPGGSGHMTQALRNDEADLCILLTEGIVTDIIRGNPCKIISEYVVSPLTWGIHTDKGNTLANANDIFDKHYAISRIGSGSHLMAMIHANDKGHSLMSDQFVVVENLNGAVDSLSRQESDVFYWEKFTTKPFVDAGKLRRIGEYMSPWPCFVIAATERILAKHPHGVAKVLDVINASCIRFMEDSTAIETVSERYKLKQVDVERWYHSTEWATNSWVSDKMLKSVVFQLRAAGIISADQAVPELIWKT
mgnify:CR=1 FL=1